MRKLAICMMAMLAFCIVPAFAEVQLNDKAPIFMLVYISCANGGAGEFVQLEGFLHTVVTATINDNNVSGKSHFQPMGVTGVGLTSGAKYQATGVTQQSFRGSLQNGQYNTTSVNNFRIIGQGPGNNFLVHENMHVTINANGEVVVTHENVRIDCK